jgi:hypothetical protein
MKSVRKLLIFSILLLLCITVLSACTQDQDIPDPVDQGNKETADTQEAESSDDTETDADDEAFAMKMRINDTDVKVSWENNDSVKALSELVSLGDVTIEMNAYGGFEQVGPIGETLPANDTSIKTKAGDIMLYTSDHMVIFYGSNSWAYTRLGRITDKSASELKELLSGAGVTVTVTAE